MQRNFFTIFSILCVWIGYDYVHVLITHTLFCIHMIHMLEEVVNQVMRDPFETNLVN
jgi:hypothetical protein